MLLADLKSMAAGLGVAGAGSMEKAQLVEAIKATQSGAATRAEQPRTERAPEQAAKKAPEMMESKAQADWYKANADRLNHDGLGDGSVITQIRHAQSQLADIHKAQVTVQNDRTMSPDAKRDRLIELSRQRDTLAEQAFRGLFAPVDQVKHR